MLCWGDLISIIMVAAVSYKVVTVAAIVYPQIGMLACKRKWWWYPSDCLV
jgi:hypothetical protein